MEGDKKKTFQETIHCYWRHENQYILPKVLAQPPARPSWELLLFQSHVSQFQSGILWKEKEEVVRDLHLHDELFAIMFSILKRLSGFLASVSVETARGAAAPDPQRRRRGSEETSEFVFEEEETDGIQI